MTKIIIIKSGYNCRTMIIFMYKIFIEAPLCLQEGEEQLSKDQKIPLYSFCLFFQFKKSPLSNVTTKTKYTVTQGSSIHLYILIGSLYPKTKHDGFLVPQIKIKTL